MTGTAPTSPAAKHGRAYALMLVLLALFASPPSLGAQANPPVAATDRYASIRHVNLNESGSLWVGFGGQFRERVESWTNFNFGAVPAAPAGVKTSDVFALTRIFASADFHAGTRFRLFAQGKSSLSTDRDLAGGRRTSDVDEIDVHQLYADVRVIQTSAGQRAVTLRGGRFELPLGRERLMSNLEWANTRRNFDGVTAAYTSTATTITAFRVEPVLVRFYRPDRRDSSTLTYGVYATRQMQAIGGDFYWIGQRRDSGVTGWNGSIGRENRQTVGARLWGPLRPGAVDWDAEAAMQFGDVGSNSISAQMAAAQVGYTFRKASRTPRVYAGLDYASGDDTPGGNVQTFSQLNPQTHAHLGAADIAGRQNLLDVSGGGSIRAWRKLSTAADFHVFRRVSATDAFYAKNGAISRAASLGASKSIASELDLTLRWPVDRYTNASAGWSYVMPGQFIKQAAGTSGADKPISFLYLMLLYTL